MKDSKSLHMLIWRIIFLLAFIYNSSCKKEPQPDSASTTIQSQHLEINTAIAPVQISGVTNKTNYSDPVTIQLIDPDPKMQYQCFLNDKEIDLSTGLKVSEPNFYTLEILSSINTDTRKDSFLFVILDPARLEKDWGLPTWVPAKFEESQIGNEEIEIIYPKDYVTGVNLPIIIKTLVDNKIAPLYLKMTNDINNEIQHLKRGIGSYNILCNSAVSAINIGCGTRNLVLNINFHEPEWRELKGEIKTTEIVANSRIKVKENISIPAGDTLIINEGTIVLVDPGINIYNSGSIVIKGTSDNPVVITCSSPQNFWGGFISKGLGNEIVISNAIICQSGYGTSIEYNWGHSGRQALFYLESSSFKASDCYFIDHIGQVFYPLNADFTLTNTLIQRAKSGGQLNTSRVLIDNCIFTDFPNESYNYQDNVNDALYVSMCDADIKNSTFMFAKDDAIDAGNGNDFEDRGTVNMDHCWIESAFHEGLALSSVGSRVHNIQNTTVTNCGQGIELGFSVASHVVNIDNCLIYKNGIGLRYGDNYTREVAGTMNVKNTILRDNIYFDVWNMLRSVWAPKLDKMNFTNTSVSKPCKQYPFLYPATSIKSVWLK